ncbi:PAS domain S-box protein [Hymenobacter bucti]|uniref:histidine kinase n=1 Tax=Hymenobacter bucti TaxID=1844114 RepID=A0ABW4QNG3_9BACT
MPPASSLQVLDLFPADALLTTVLDLSPTGMVLCAPVHDQAGHLVDVALAYLNPAAQRLLHLPAQPGTTFTQQFAGSRTDGSWALVHGAFGAPAPGHPAAAPAVRGPQHRLHLAAQRVGGGLLLSFSEAPAGPEAPAPPAEPGRLAERSQQLERFDAVLGSLQEFVYLFDLEGRFRYVNQPLLDLWGLPLEQALGKNFFDLGYPAPLATQLQTQIQQVAATRQPVTGETAYTSPTGETGEFEYTFVPLLGPDGAVEAVGGRTHPATEHRRAAAALRASEAKYRTLFETIDEGFCLIEMLFDGAQRPVNYRFVEVNPAFERQTGLAGATGRTIGELAPQLEQHWFNTYGAVARTGQPVRFEQRAAQLHRWFDVYAFRVGEPGQHRVAVLFTDISQRRQAEEILRQSEQQHAFLLQLSDQLRPLVDAADIQYQAACALGRYLGASRVGYAEDLGDGQHIEVTRNYTQPGVPSLAGHYHYDDYGPELLQTLKEGRTVVRPDIAHDPTLTAAEKAAHAALQLGATVNVPLRKDGQLRAVLFMHYPTAHAWTADELALLEETAERTWAAVMRARVEAALRESEERFRVMADAVPQIVWIMDADGRTEFFNRQWGLYTGGPLEPSTAATVANNYVHPDDGAPTIRAFEEARRTGTIFQVEHRIRAADGTYRWFLVRAEPFRDPTSGQILRWFGSSVDIHDRKQVEEALLRSQERLQKALSIDTVGILFFDLAGDLHDGNAAFERMSGYARAELAQGQIHLDALTAPGFAAATQQALHELRTTGESTPFEKQYQRPDGSYWWGLSAGKRLSDTECVKFVLDITEAKRAEEALRHSQQLLQRSNEQLTRTNVDLDNFIYTASHDLKSPITNIEGLLHELQAQLPAAAQRAYDLGPLLTMMQESVARFQRTIDHLSDITKLQKEHDQPITEVLLPPVVEDICQDLLPLLKATGAQVEVDFAAYPRVLFSPKNLRSLLYNLLSNAVKYRHPARPPRVRLSCYPDPTGQYLVLRVQDNGLGVEASHYQELFAMFRRLHSHVEGSGIGLYMVKRMVENVGGRIEVDSQVGLGSTFSVYLPYPPGSAAQPSL